MDEPSTAPSIEEPLPPEGLEVPVRATFAGLNRVPVISLGHNNAFPVLRLYRDGIETRVLRKRRRPYAAIREVGVMTTWGTLNVEFVWEGSIITFTANIRDEPWRLALLGFLADRGVTLTGSARNLLEGQREGR